MAQSLRDQFLKMGLVDKKQATQAKKATYKKTKEQDKGRIQSPDENKIRAQQALAEKKKLAQSANQKQQEEAKKAEKIAQLRQLIATNRLPLKDGVIAYRFTDNNKIAKIFVPTKEMVDELSQGRLAIVREKTTYAVVPSAIAEKIREWQPELIVLSNASQQKLEDDPDDPYAAYKIPDDLIW
ncbi:MAG: DUF2058 domain-containing protein [Desulfocapsaceae bacterium]|nr:DUF2058 domain-containing protein [Desulfocapsaceae bacterium]